MEFGPAAGLLVLGFPLLLLAGVIGLARLESSFLEPDERADALGRLLERPLAAEDVERLATGLLKRAEPLDRRALRIWARSRAAST